MGSASPVVAWIMLIIGAVIGAAWGVLLHLSPASCVLLGTGLGFLAFLHATHHS